MRFDADVPVKNGIGSGDAPDGRYDELRYNSRYVQDNV